MSTIRVDTVSEYTSANGVAIDSVTLKDGAVYPSSADGGALGAAANEWSDIYIADSGVIYFGNDQEIKITHVADTGLNLKHTATADDKPIVLTLQTGETDLAADDVIGKIAFQAPDEGTGTDAILVSAAIQARAEGNHSSSSNATSIDFMTGASEAATKKLSITSAGHFIPGTDNTYDVGTSSLEFKDGYFDGTLYCDTLNLAGTNHTSISGGSWVKILQTTASTAASVEFKHGTSSVVIDSTYNTYCIVYTGAFGSAITSWNLQVSPDTGSSYDTSGYYSVRLTGNYAGGSSSHTVDDYTDRLMFVNQQGSGIATGGNGMVYIYSPANASAKTQGAAYGVETSDGTNNVRHQIGFGVHNTAEAIDAFRILPASGTLTGTFTLYGLVH